MNAKDTLLVLPKSEISFHVKEDHGPIGHYHQADDNDGVDSCEIVVNTFANSVIALEDGECKYGENERKNAQKE